jgi:hypothetical protein
LLLVLLHTVALALCQPLFALFLPPFIFDILVRLLASRGFEAKVDPEDLSVGPESGWRGDDDDHFDYLLGETLSGNYMKNVFGKPKVSNM